MDALGSFNLDVVAAIGWFYLATNSLRMFTYVPQILAVWHCRDGARSISLITWYSWAVSNLTAIAYGTLVVHDEFFTFISTINFTCCTAIALIASSKRRTLRSSLKAETEADAEAAAPRDLAPSVETVRVPPLLVRVR